MKKYYRIEIKDNRSVCPVCGKVNNHNMGNAHDCPHIAKVTSKGIAFYFWGFRPNGFVAN